MTAFGEFMHKLLQQPWQPRRVVKLIGALCVGLGLLTSGCTSMRPYFATKAEHQQCWQERQDEADREAEKNALDGPLGLLLDILANVAASVLPRSR